MKNRVTMQGRIDPCWLFVYRAPEEMLQAHLPPPLDLVTHRGMSFINVVVCRLHGMKPADCFLPLTLNYWHVAYRLYARYAGEEGLYFLRSDADSALIHTAGNLLTSFQFHRADVSVERLPEEAHISVAAQGADVEASVCATLQKRLMPGSSFASLKTAAEFLKYKPAAFSVDEGRVSILRITRDEAAWKSKLVQVRQARFEFIEERFPGSEFELCYEVEPIDYVWNRAEALEESRGLVVG